MIFKTLINNTKKYECTSLVHNEKKYSYSELINQVSLIKELLKDKNKAGLIYLPKNEYVIMFMLALNEGNNVFTTLDINTPIDRVHEIINQLKPKWIISLESFSDLGFNEIEKNKNYKIVTKEDSLTYNEKVSHIYFSSGSTGKPKGILLSAEPLIKVVTKQAKIIGMESGKRFAWLLSPSFDASLSDIFLTLLSGGELHICDFPQTKIKTLLSYFKSNKITHSDISPTVLPLLKNSGLFLESIIFGGEVANENIIKDFSKKIKMFNAYGPTETTICSSFKKVNEKWTANNIGKPLPGVRYIIASNNELYISGTHLCIGYLNEELNKSKFIIENNKRYYKTGDLVEYKNNEYFYIGRVDRQFKHNGVLISPEEIENIAKLAGCIDSKCEYKEKFILYYQGNIEEKALRLFMEKKINKNMIPNVFFKVDSFEINMNGKKKI